MGEALHRRPAQQICLQGNCDSSDPGLGSFMTLTSQSSSATTAPTASPGAKSAGVVLLPSLAVLGLSLAGLGTVIGL